MAGNKALKKFQESKIPKKGTGPSRREINIYKEPNTHSDIIGKIKEGESFNWIYKSICDNKEFLRCDNKQNFGYVIGTEEDGSYNLDVDKIIKSQEIKKEAFTTEKITLTKEEMELGEEALKKILNEDDLKIEKENNINENNTDALNTNLNEDDSKISAETDISENNTKESFFENTLNNKEDLGLDNLNNLDYDDINFKIAVESE